MMRHAVGTGILAIVVLAVPAQAEDKTTQRAWDAGGRAAPALMVKMTPQRVTEGDARAWARQPVRAQGRPVAVQTATVPPPPPRVIREAQTMLAGLGYDPGPVDGVWNETTVQAYQKFLRDAGLPAAETLTPDTLRTLRTLAKFRGGGPGRGEAVPPAKAAPPDALHRAAKAGNLDGLKAALAAGADVNARDGRGWTALMHAVNKGYILLVEPLLAAKADMDVRGPDGATALFMAVAHGQTEIIMLLVEAGADVSIKGPKGKTAVDVAQMSEESAILSALGIPQPGDVFRDCDACPEMVIVPAGTYLMGSPASEEGRGNNEGPVHRVTMAQPFAVGKYEVTFAEWDACVAGGGCGGYRPADAGWGRGTRPVINVSWKDAQAYVRWLSEQTGQGYRLLSEAEWEYVARAGTTTAFHTGSTISTEQANYNGNHTYGSGRKGEYRGRTVPVGSFPANGFGLHDVHGNVWEWTQDCWNVGYGGAPVDGWAWESGECVWRMLRGGSWFDSPRDLRSANRSKYTSWTRNFNDGFRLARTLTP